MKNKIFKIIGEWVKFSGFSTSATIVKIYNDNTALINKRQYTWKFCDSEAKNERLSIKLFADNNSSGYIARFSAEKQKDIFVMQIANDRFCNKLDFDIIEIDKENFNKFFEIKEYFNIRTLKYYIYWSLKEDFLVDINKSYIECECSWIENRRILKLDDEIKLNRLPNTYTTSKSEINEFLSYSNTLIFKIGEIKVRRIANTSGKKFLLDNFPTNIKIDSIIGTLYIYK